MKIMNYLSEEWVIPDLQGQGLVERQHIGKDGFHARRDPVIQQVLKQVNVGFPKFMQTPEGESLPDRNIAQRDPVFC